MLKPWILAALAAPLLALATPSATVTTPQVHAELVAHAPDGVASGKPLWLGLKLVHQPHWHTYWKNPGDSGLPTSLQWSWPAGVTAGDIAWPTPQRLPIGPLMNYGYEGTLLLPVPVTLPAGDPSRALEVRLRADWLVCKVECIPEGGDFVLRLPARQAVIGHADLFAAARAAQPQAMPGVTARAGVEGPDLVVRVAGMPPAWQGQALGFLPELPSVINHAARPDARWQGDTWTARVPLDPQRAESPAVLPVVLIANGMPAGLCVDVALTTPWAPSSATVAAPVAAGAAPPGGVMTTPAPGLLLALGLALIGGALLNLMPCVFPVLSLKVLGFATQPQGRRAALAGGLAYTAGVVLSFVGLAGLLLVLRAGGEQLGWGFQLQSPPVVAALAALFTLIALNLAGVFEVGSVLPSAWASAHARHPVVDAFLTGVLAVAVASPCTAPFMGAALGAALSWSAVPALLVFATLGLGMAAPYLAASAWPTLARLLPRPGPWMAHFRSVMAFPMWATVIWLTWVLGVQLGADGVAALLGLLLALAFLAWALGAPALGPGARRGLGAVAGLVLAAVLVWAGPSLRADSTAAATAPAEGDVWQPWSPQRVAAARAEGRTVFVDFTAAWCVTCQFNKRTTLASAEVQAAFAQHRVLLLRADWTRRDATISAELARMGRSGVPAYVVFSPAAAAPSVLSEILTVSEVLAAIRPAR